MQNLIAFLRRFRVFIFFSILQFLCFILYIQFVTYPKSVYLSTASGINGNLRRWEGGLTDHFLLEENNRQLRRENAQLKQRVFSNFYKVNRPVIQVKDTSYEQQFKYIPSRIIQATTNRRNNYFTIDVGDLQGIKKGMGVISPRGVVGTVFKVGKHFSLVRSILSKTNTVEVVLGNDGPIGLLKWDGFNPKTCVVTGVRTDIGVKKNTKIFTLGSSGIFPKGIEIGRIIKKSKQEAQDLWNIEVLFNEDYRTLQTVYVIKSLMLKELQRLQLEIPEEEEEQ